MGVALINGGVHSLRMKTNEQPPFFIQDQSKGYSQTFLYFSTKYPTMIQVHL